MNIIFLKKTCFVSVVLLGLMGCGQKTMPVPEKSVISKDGTIQFESISINGTKDVFKVQSAKLLSIPYWSEAHLIQTSKTQGLQILNRQNHVLQSIDGAFGDIDYHIKDNLLFIQSVDLKQQRPTLLIFDMKSKQWQPSILLEKTKFKIEAVCLYQDQSQQLYSFVIGGQGSAQQWAVNTTPNAKQPMQLVRNLNIPIGSKSCVVEDQQERLLINEEGIGIWEYLTDAEQPFKRKIVDIVKPYGHIEGSPGAFTQVDNMLFVVDTQQPFIYKYIHDGKNWQISDQLNTAELKKPEQLSAKREGEKVQLLLNDNHKLKIASLPYTTAHQDKKKDEHFQFVQAKVQTTPVPNVGDAADDPAIWYNEEIPTASRILGTDKQGGLQVYSLDGKEQQYLAVGRLNNVDIRPNFNWDGQRVDLAVATNRDHNSLHLFAIEKKTGHVSEIGQAQTSLKDIYGLCLYQNKQGDIYAIPSDKDGTFIQYHLSALKNKVNAKEIQKFSVRTQPEGCVVDDKNDQIFLGEEDRAVWQKSLLQNNSNLQEVATVGKNQIQDDIEGMGLYHGKKQSYLVVSSQGNNSYAVMEAHAPYRYRGSFKIVMNSVEQIDAVSETDGLDVTSHNLGGVWEKGMLVVQDGHKVMPEDHQNFKYVPWSEISEKLNLEE